MQLVEKIEAVIRRMRLKTIFFMKEDKDEDHAIPESYGLKSETCPKQQEELIPFENDLIQLVKEIKFRRVNNNFQKKLAEDLKTISSSKKTVTPADKTSNMYRLEKGEYEKLLHDSITTTYKKASTKLEKRINTAGKKFAKDKNLLDKMEINAKNECFITLKDHKENFLNNPKTRLINPAKNEIGRISKIILDKINKELTEKLNINQWKSNVSVLDWFKAIENKHECTFTVFDIEQFYPSIKESVLLKALDFAKKHTKVLNKDIDVIRHSRRSLLFNQGETWVKREEENFDVTMGAYDGAEVCELVGIYLQSLIGEKYNKNNFGLYRDDGLAVFRKVNGQQSERIKKDLQKIFKENYLNIEISCNKKIVNYLDVTMNLNDGSYRPYQKPNDELMYIHSESNHPPAIIKQLPLSIEKRLKTLSSSKEIFDEAAKPYQKALERNGYKHILKYEEDSGATKRNRKRNIIWFNPPYSKSVTTNVGRYFLQLVEKHFPKHNKLHKIFNKNTIKVSYSCLPNVKSSVNKHNKKVLRKVNEDTNSNEPVKTCSCPRNTECPLNNCCYEKDIQYSAEVTSNLPNYGTKIYKGICATTWKERFGNHKKSFNNEEYEKETALSVEIWRIKRAGGEFHIKWSKESTKRSYTPEGSRCSLCLHEKLVIALYEGNNLINKRNEIISRCRHRLKYKLKNLVY